MIITADLKQKIANLDEWHDEFAMEVRRLFSKSYKLGSDCSEIKRLINDLKDPTFEEDFRGHLNELDNRQYSFEYDIGGFMRDAVEISTKCSALNDLIHEIKEKSDCYEKEKIDEIEESVSVIPGSKFI